MEIQKARLLQPALLTTHGYLIRSPTCQASDSPLEYQGKLSMIFFPKILDHLSRSKSFRFYFLSYSLSFNQKMFIEYLLCAITVLVAGNLTVTGTDLTFALYVV